MKPIKPLREELYKFAIENNISRCCYCGRKYDGVKVKRTLDHIIPRSKGGVISIDNTLVCCQGCNNKKGNDSIEEFLLKNKRAKECLRKYFVKIEKCWINGKSYYNALDWIYTIIKKKEK